MAKRTDTQAQAQAQVGERILAMLEDFGARLTALESPAQIVPATPTDEAKPARKATKAEKAMAKAKREAKAANAARTQRNVAAGRMASARFACDGCKHASYKAEVAQAHAAKTGHVVRDA
jgi:hypothetical protein